MAVYLRDDDTSWDEPDTEDCRPKCAHGLYEGDCDTCLGICLDEASRQIEAGRDVPPDVRQLVEARDALRRR